MRKVHVDIFGKFADFIWKLTPWKREYFHTKMKLKLVTAKTNEELMISKVAYSFVCSFP